MIIPKAKVDPTKPVAADAIPTSTGITSPPLATSPANPLAAPIKGLVSQDNNGQQIVALDIFILGH